MLPYIDCIRGYAVLMVITSHLTYVYPELPYPVHRLTTMGWYGVQLFFLASCVTLLLSWTKEKQAAGKVDVGAFFIRRYFRIAPAYYMAAALYYVLAPPAGGFDLRQLLTAFAFINTWFPTWTPTVSGFWTVVPGGWSIGVEFSFYALFPLFAAISVTLPRALAAFVACVVIGALSNAAVLSAFSTRFGIEETRNFLFFWFPNQFCVFALGGVIFQVLREAGTSTAAWAVLLRQNGTSIAFACASIMGVLAYVPMGKYLGDRPYLPAFLATSVVLAGFVLALSAGRGVLVNRCVAAMGRVSFSAYLSHFAVLQLFDRFPNSLRTDATGIDAVAAFSLSWLPVVGLTYVLSWLSFQLVERPMMNVGKRLTRTRRVARDVPAARAA